MSERETRILDLEATGLEVRDGEAEDEGRTLVGYGAKFGTMSQDLGGFRETIAPEAFNRTVKNMKDILVTFNHDVNHLLGRTGASTARVSVDEVGVRYEVDLPQTATGRDVEALAARGDLFGSSFTFSVVDDEWDKDADGGPVRTLNEVRLYELGPVVSPAYLDTSVALRSLEVVEEDATEDEDTTQENPTRVRRIGRGVR